MVSARALSSTSQPLGQLQQHLKVRAPEFFNVPQPSTADSNVFESPIKVPVAEIPLHERFLDTIRQHVRNNPNEIAFVSAEDPDKATTFKTFYDNVLSVSQFLSDRGFGHKDVVAQVIPNSLQYPTVFLAAMRCGGAMSGASAMFTDFELERQFRDSGSKAVVTNEENLGKVLDAVSRCPKVETVICVRTTRNPLPEGVFDYDEVLKTTPTSIPAFNFQPDDMCLLPYSSGTTGAPKGVMLSHKNMGTMMNMFDHHFEKYFVPYLSEPGSPFVWKNEHVPLVLPFYHIYGFVILMRSILSGFKGIIFKKYDSQLFLKTLQDKEVKLAFLVPPILVYMAKHDAAGYDLSKLRLVVSAAAPVGKDLAEEFMERFPKARVAQAYGMTECSMCSHMSTLKDGVHDYTTVGQLMPNYEQKIVDVSTGEAVPRGKLGEVCIRAETIMKGYLNRPEATQTTVDADGWLHTGDIGFVDEFDQMTVVDRIKELIKVKGLQVPPAELEDLLLSHDHIDDAAVIGIPDKRCGEVPLAFVVKASPELTEEEVKKFVEERVSSYKQLAGGVIFIDKVPKSPSGKILRRLLREKLDELKK